MRTIKFRAWDKISQKYLYPWPDGFGILGETTCFDLIGQQLKERNPEKTIMEMLDDVILEQFTGLLDKKGKEIYEGDIVRCKGSSWKTDDSYDYTAEIIWSEDGFGTKRNIMVHKRLSWCIDNKKPKPNTVEVVGNIHEQPESNEK
jgi:uncharacterized phage protein (TIGR01671 family)